MLWEKGYPFEQRLIPPCAAFTLHMTRCRTNYRRSSRIKSNVVRPCAVSCKLESTTMRR